MLEKEVEILKENLVIKNLYFNPVKAYKVFLPAPEKGRNLTIKNILFAYSNLDIKLTEKDALLLMKRFDSN